MPKTMTDPKVRRSYHASFVCRAAEADNPQGGWTVNGLATVFDYAYPIYGGAENGGWDEEMAAGSVSKTLSERPDVVFLINHEGMPLARTAHGTAPGTLFLDAEPSGLRSIAHLDGRSQRAAELAIAMDRQDMDEMSMAFWVIRDQWLTADGEEVPWWDMAGVKRRITEISMHKGDTSVVNYGANDATSAEVQARALKELRSAARLWTPAQQAEARRSLDAEIARIARDAKPRFVGVPSARHASMDSVACPACGHGNERDAKCCDQCGAAMEETSTDPTPLIPRIEPDDAGINGEALAQPRTGIDARAARILAGLPV